MHAFRRRLNVTSRCRCSAMKPLDVEYFEKLVKISKLKLEIAGKFEEPRVSVITCVRACGREVPDRVRESQTPSAASAKECF